MIYPIVTSSGNLILSPTVINFPPLKHSQNGVDYSHGRLQFILGYYGNIYNFDRKVNDFSALKLL